MQLKTRLLILILIIIFSEKVFPQENLSQPAFKAGMNINDLGGKEAGIYNSFGFHAGFSYEYIVVSYFSLQPELLFSLQGGTVDQSLNNRLNYYYLNLPLLAKFYLIDDLSLEAGPQYGYLVAANRRDDFGKINITENVRRSDFAVVFGFGYKYRNKTSISARYNLGFTDTIQRGVIFQQRLSNRVFQASVAFIF